VQNKKPFDMTEVAHVERIVVGNTDPRIMKTEDEIQAQMDRVNECLQRSPKGKILAQEKGFAIYTIGEHQVVLQHVVYHVGFVRRPAWLKKEE